MLTEEFVDEFYRYLLSYQYDNTVENVWIESKDNVFTHGVDYKRLSEDKQYLDKLAKLAILVAQFNKPIFAQVAGGSKGAGAYLLSMINMPLGYKSAFLKLDEVFRGMVPLMGGSHRLARFPLHLGYYLALTGDQLNSEQMAQLGLLRGEIAEGVTNSSIRKKFHQANLYFRERFRYMDFDEEGSMLQAEQKLKIQENKALYESELKHYQAQLLTKNSKNMNVKFAANQRLVASADYYNTTEPFNSFNEGESGRTINNYFQMRLERPLNYLKEKQLVNPFQIDGLELKRLQVGKIDEIFGKNTIEEVLEALKRENSPWAQRAYKRMTSADPLALKLTFELLKRAESRSWIECLETEFTVARRLMEMSELQLKTYVNSSQYVFVNDYSKGGLVSVAK